MLRRFSTGATRLAIRSTRGRPAVKTETKPRATRNTVSADPGPATPATAPASAPAAPAAPAHPKSVPSMFPEGSEEDTLPMSAMPADDTLVSTLEQLEAPADRSDWSTSFAGLGSASFSERATEILLAPVVPEDVEVTPDGLIYLPEIKYRRILNRAFGPGGWGIAPRTKTLVTNKKVTREYGLVCLGRLVSVSRGEMDFFNQSGITTAMEGCKSNALMRCCKDLGIASELWDPSFIRDFKRTNCDQKYFDKKKRFVWKRKDRPWEYPYV